MQRILRFVINLLVVLGYSLFFLPVVIVYSRTLTVTLNSVKAAFDFKIWGIEFDKTDDFSLAILVMIFVSLTCLMAAQLLVLENFTQKNEAKEALKSQLVNKVENIIQDRNAILAKLNKK